MAFRYQNKELHQESDLSEKEQISLLQNNVRNLSSNVRLEYKHIAKIERFIKWLCLESVLILILIVYLIIFHVS